MLMGSPKSSPGAISTAWRISASARPRDLAKFIAVKGSVALDGTSLTVNAVEGASFEVLLIPHTLKVTTWGDRKAGDTVNIEVDQMARYAARLMEAGREGLEATCQPVRART